jgi:ABC-2 type transport system permease protein/oleandomycin transport system permease protein
MALTWRTLLTIRRLPQLLAFATIQPLRFVQKVRSVFGGAITVPGVDDVNSLMPGVFARTVASGAVKAGVGLAEDKNSGLVPILLPLVFASSAFVSADTMPDGSRRS